MYIVTQHVCLLAACTPIFNSGDSNVFKCLNQRFVKGKQCMLLHVHVRCKRNGWNRRIAKSKAGYVITIFSYLLRIYAELDVSLQSVLQVAWHMLQMRCLGRCAHAKNCPRLAVLERNEPIMYLTKVFVSAMPRRGDEELCAAGRLGQGKATEKWHKLACRFAAGSSNSLGGDHTLTNIKTSYR